MEAPIFEPPPDTVGPEGGMGEPVPGGPETFWQKVLRFFRGLFGLDSGQTTPEMPGEEMPPVEPEPQPVEVVPLKGP